MQEPLITCSSLRCRCPSCGDDVTLAEGEAEAPRSPKTVEGISGTKIVEVVTRSILWGQCGCPDKVAFYAEINLSAAHALKEAS